MPLIASMNSDSLSGCGSASSHMCKQLRITHSNSPNSTTNWVSSTYTHVRPSQPVGYRYVPSQIHIFTSKPFVDSSCPSYSNISCDARVLTDWLQLIAQTSGLTKPFGSVQRYSATARHRHRKSWRRCQRCIKERYWKQSHYRSM